MVILINYYYRTIGLFHNYLPLCCMLAGALKQFISFYTFYPADFSGLLHNIQYILKRQRGRGGNRLNKIRVYIAGQVGSCYNVIPVSLSGYMKNDNDQPYHGKTYMYNGCWKAPKFIVFYKVLHI